MNREELIQRLAELPTEIEAAEREVLETNLVAEGARAALADREAELVDAGLEGKNTESRHAELHLLTAVQRETVATADKALALRRVDLNRLHNDFRAAQLIAGLLKD